MNPSSLVRRIAWNARFSFSTTVNSGLNYETTRAFGTSSKEETVCYIWGGGSGLNPFAANTTEKEVLQPDIFPAPLPEGTSTINAPKPSPIVDIAFGMSHEIFLTKDGLVYVRGSGKKNQLGLGEEIKEAETPTQVPGISDIVQIAAGKHHSIVLNRNGEVFTWGDKGALGHPKAQWWHLNQEPCPVPTKVKSLSQIKAIAAGDLHCIALSEKGEVFSWGNGEHGRLGHGGAGYKTEPERITAFDGITIQSIRCGSAFNGAVSENNELWVWGRNDRGQCANAESLQVDIMRQETIPSLVEGFENPKVIAIDCGSQEMTAVTSDNHLYQWGNGIWMEPHKIEGDNQSMLKVKVVNVASGKGYSFALDNEGHVFSWGKGGQLGLGHKQAIGVPQAIPGFGPTSQDNLGKAIKIIAGTHSSSRVAAIAVKKSS